MGILIMSLLSITAIFLILLVLVQRGRGGGLAGAFGGMGGQSAFGTKAGDLFTRITIGVATFWIILCAFSVWYFGSGNQSPLAQDLGSSSSSAPANPASGTPGAGPTTGAAGGTSEKDRPSAAGPAESTPPSASEPSSEPAATPEESQ